jgi:hypothetical protein
MLNGACCAQTATVQCHLKHDGSWLLSMNVTCLNDVHRPVCSYSTCRELRGACSSADASAWTSQRRSASIQTSLTQMVGLCRSPRAGTAVQRCSSHEIAQGWLPPTGHSAAADGQHRTYTMCRWLATPSQASDGHLAACPRMMCESTCAAGQPQEIDADHFHRTADLTLGELLQKVDKHLQQQGDRAGAGMHVDMTEGAPSSSIMWRMSCRRQYTASYPGRTIDLHKHAALRQSIHLVEACILQER